MSKLNIIELERQIINEVDKRVEDNYDLIEEIINNKIDSIIEDLDETIGDVNKDLKEDVNRISNEKIHNYILSITTKLYYIYEKLEKLGIKLDVSKLIYKDCYNKLYLSIKGTIEDKKQFAELNSVYENTIKLINERCYKIINGKIERALEIVNSLKKVLSARMLELETTKFSSDYYLETKNKKNKDEF